MKYIYTILTIIFVCGQSLAQVDSVNLTSFVGVAVEGGVDLTWKTEGEYNAQKFKLERSLDAITFEEVAIWNCTNSTTEKVYQHKEEGVYRAVVYYRLKTTFANKEKYSKTIAVTRSDIENLPAISIYPTIVQQQINIVKSSDEDLKGAQVRIFDMSGRLLHAQTVKDDFVKLNVDVTEYGVGAYVIELRKGKFASKAKFVKQ